MAEPAKITYRVDQPASGHFLAPSPLGFEATLAQLKSAIAAAELWLVHEIDTQMLVAKAGLQIRPTRQLLFFHPRYMVRLLAEDAAALPEVPLKVVVTEDEEGRVWVRAPDPAVQLGRYPALTALAAELSTIVTSIVGVLAKPVEGI